MGATSVTGKGFGSAEAANKGAQGRQTLGVGHLIGPHVVYAGSVQLSGGAATVNISPLVGAASDYIVLASNQDTSSPAAVGASLSESNGDWTLTVGGSGTDTVSYAIISVGN